MRKTARLVVLVSALGASGHTLASDKIELYCEDNEGTKTEYVLTDESVTSGRNYGSGDDTFIGTTRVVISTNKEHLTNAEHGKVTMKYYYLESQEYGPDKLSAMKTYKLIQAPGHLYLGMFSAEVTPQGGLHITDRDLYTCTPKLL
ncbi:hypothetical protein BCT61_12615 [Vibrio breoganii]|uniref:hypothetical protein n=1 Tax=Vibrio breoganii TaxID=553239 RepID=UPI000C85B1FA|nr:hypothetical protein [Vibrio breoganii]PMG05202.1 hypothetical protein BCV00_13555 [Vibrio breoganii]PMG89406.1 hypothetical protein BCU81_08530 [Vibrio breoganii]PMM08375.1 hypothetical protein BCT61_12615 [Vibrio breoganii]